MTTILIVDDEYLIADILGYALEDEGYLVAKASNGKKGLEVLEQSKPSLVITDYMMPVMNGVEFAQAIRGEAGNVRLPIILMSGAQANIGRLSPDLFTAVFDKPFDIAKLVAKVQELIEPGTYPATGSRPAPTQFHEQDTSPRSNSTERAEDGPQSDPLPKDPY